MRSVLAAAVAMLLLSPAGALAGEYTWGEAEQPPLTSALKDVPEPLFEAGPCTGEARRAMPAADGHDHLDVTQHRFACRMEKVFFDPLADVLADRPDVVLGEMDVKGDLMVVAISYPESGFLLYDVSNPARPEFLSHYRGEECEQVVSDVDCGAYVDLSPDGRRVYISLQQTTVLYPPSLQQRPLAAYPGVEVVDVSLRTVPILLQTMPVPSLGGVHTTRSFTVPEAGGEGPREPGEYIVSVANGVGLAIHRVTPAGTLVPVNVMDVGETHDTFIQEDPILGRTLLYAAGGFTTGFYVWDITAPTAPELLGEWDATPECGADFYAHTIDVAVRDGRRVVTMPNEHFDFFGEQGDDPENCGTLQGLGDRPGSMWFVDATDFSKLGPASTDGKTDAENAELKAASLGTLITYWSNAANRAAGPLTFTPHNQQIAGDKVYLSQYHGGTVVLDAADALRGRNVRPKEVGLYVPHEGPQRPIVPDAGSGFVTGFTDFRPLIWDMTFKDGHVLMPDMTGGLTVAREDGTPVVDAPPAAPPGRPACSDRVAPTVRVRRVRLTRRAVRVNGRAADRGCAPVSRVAVAVARLRGKRCAFLSGPRRFERPRSCRKALFAGAAGRERWAYRLRARLPRGRYVVMVRATDTQGNRGRVVKRRARVR